MAEVRSSFSSVTTNRFGHLGAVRFLDVDCRTDCRTATELTIRGLDGSMVENLKSYLFCDLDTVAAE